MARMDTARWLSEPGASEFTGAVLGDPRRTRRLCEIAERLSEDPTASFPDAFGSSAELEGFYRFIRNDNVSGEGVLEPHYSASCGRAAEVGECLAIHDTTEFTFKGERDGLGRTSSKAQGFFAHVSLLVATDEARTPLGVVGSEQYARKDCRGRSTVEKRRDDECSEGLRWLRGAASVERRLAGRAKCIHVADREGDTFQFLSGLLDLGAHFVIRVAQDRRLEDEFGDAIRLHDELLDMQPVACFDIAITARGKRLNPTMARTHPSRKERVARVSMAATTVTVARPRSRLAGSPIELNLVRVWETQPPANEPPVEWILWTTEPVDSVGNIRRIVDFYRSRWVIEEFFKALKTGCSFEKRQLESFKTLTTALAVFVPVAWKLLLMRSLAQSRPEGPPSIVLTPIQIDFLEKKYGKRLETARAALLATAELGGHLKQNGEPGWQTLGRGYEKLVAGEAFFSTLQSSPTCDQS